MREALDRALNENRLSRALLFHGPAGVGKLTAAVSLARELLCAAGAGRACGACADCRKVDAGALLHPDVTILHPQAREESPSKPADDAAQSGPDLHGIQEEVRRNPSWRILAEPARRRLSHLYLSPSGGRSRLLLVISAERLNEESGNALLKILEEPPSWAVLLLLCENPAALLPTLRSRCRHFRFQTLSRPEIRSFLTERSLAGPDAAALLAALSAGRPGRALALANDPEDYLERRSHLVKVLSEVRSAGSTPAAALAAAGEVFADEASTQEGLSVLADVVRDAMLSGSGCAAGLLTRPETDPLHGSLDLAPLQAAAFLVRIERAREDLRRFVNRQLALESLILDLVNPPTPRPWAD